MWRLCSIAVALAGLALSTGCGLIKSGLNTREAHATGAVTTTLDAPVSRVLMALQEANGQEFLFEEESITDFAVETMSVPGMKALNDGATPGKFEMGIPLDVSYGSGSMVGKTKDGRIATLWLLERDHARKTEVSVRIGKPNEAGLASDPELIFEFFGRIEDKLAHPTRFPKGNTRFKASVGLAVDPAPKKDATPANQGGPDR
jgi:hypothetical protein